MKNTRLQTDFSNSSACTNVHKMLTRVFAEWMCSKWMFSECEYAPSECDLRLTVCKAYVRLQCKAYNARLTMCKAVARFYLPSVEQFDWTFGFQQPGDFALLNCQLPYLVHSASINFQSWNCWLKSKNRFDWASIWGRHKPHSFASDFL